MTKAEFYRDERVVRVEWWLHDNDFPALTWGRLRVFDDGTADILWDEGGTLNGFAAREFAAHHLTEDEYIRFGDWDADDEAEYGLKVADIAPPAWADHLGQPFRYFGTY